MTNRYHIKENGEPGLCTATKVPCPVNGGNTEHYDTEADARKAYEKQQENKPAESAPSAKKYPEYTKEESWKIAQTIKGQIQTGTFMTLGASDFVAIPGGLRFNARILPFNANGERSERVAKMFVEVKLNGHDYYDINVYRLKKFKVDTHYQVEDVDVSGLNPTLYALDYDGPEARNPRFY